MPFDTPILSYRSTYPNLIGICRKMLTGRTPLGYTSLRECPHTDDEAQTYQFEVSK